VQRGLRIRAGLLAVATVDVERRDCSRSGNDASSFSGLLTRVEIGPHAHQDSREGPIAQQERSGYEMSSMV
jgi:hypothetical protein